MRILHITHYFLPHRGGEEEYVYHLGQELLKAGHEVLVLTSGLPGSPALELMDGIKVLRYKPLVTILRNPITPGMLFPNKHLHGFDIIHAQGEYSFTTNAGVFLKHYLHLPLVMTCYGKSDLGNRFANSVERIYNVTAGKVTLDNADKIIALSVSGKKHLQASGIDENRIEVNPSGIDLANWEPYLNQNTSRFLNKYRLDNRKIILFAGAITERKGVRYLIEALPKIIATHPDVGCLFVGDGDYKKNAENLVSNLNLKSHVVFTGRVTDDDLALAYKSCQVFALPSLFEQTPATILEAFTFSKPVVSTDIDGIKDYFKDTALLVPTLNSDALASAIITILNTPELARDMGEKGRALVEEHFTWQRHVDKVLELYKQAIEK